jgi:hypothetical protein
MFKQNQSLALEFLLDLPDFIININHYAITHILKVLMNWNIYWVWTWTIVRDFVSQIQLRLGRLRLYLKVILLLAIVIIRIGFLELIVY